MWDIALETLRTFASWQFWLVALGSTVLVMLLNGLLMSTLALPTVGGALGWITIPVMWLLPSVVVTAGMILLIPEMLFRRGHLGFDYLSALGMFGFLKVFGAAFLGTLIAAFIPIVGRSSTVISLVQAVIVLSVSLGLLSDGQIQVWPDIWTASIMAICIAVAIWLIAMLLSFPVAMVTGGGESGMELVAMVLGSAMTYMAAAVYAGWIRVENLG